MARILAGFALLLAATLLQITLVMRVSLLQGSADLVLLVMIVWMLLPGQKPHWIWGLAAGVMLGFVSALPDWVLWVGYACAAGICQLLKLRIWQGQMLTLLSVTILGTLFIHLVTLIYLFMSASPVDAWEAVNLITIPTLLLNLIFVLPVYAIMGELNKMVTPLEAKA